MKTKMSREQALECPTVNELVEKIGVNLQMPLLDLQTNHIRDFLPNEEDQIFFP